jgi:hypothetical protein
MTTVTIPLSVAIEAMYDARESRHSIERTFEAAPNCRLRCTDEIDRRIRVLEEAVGFGLASSGTVFRHRALVPLAYYHQSSAPAPAASRPAGAQRSSGHVFRDWHREMIAIGQLRLVHTPEELDDVHTEAGRQFRQHSARARAYRREYLFTVEGSRSTSSPSRA